MKLPWVSRLAYESVLGERDRLRTQNDQLVDHLTRIARREAGLAETVRTARPKRDPIPQTLNDHINGYQNTDVRRHMRNDALRRRQAGESWESVTADITRPEVPYGQPQQDAPSR